LFYSFVFCILLIFCICDVVVRLLAVEQALLDVRVRGLEPALRREEVHLGRKLSVNENGFPESRWLCMRNKP